MAPRKNGYYVVEEFPECRDLGLLDYVNYETGNYDYMVETDTEVTE